MIATSPGLTVCTVVPAMSIVAFPLIEGICIMLVPLLILVTEVVVVKILASITSLTSGASVNVNVVPDTEYAVVGI